MALQDSVAPYYIQEDIENGLSQDFDLFSPTRLSGPCHGQLNLTGPSSVKNEYLEATKSTSDKYTTSNMTSSLRSEEPWFAWYQTAVDQDANTLTVSKAKTKPSITDSGYGSVESVKGHEPKTDSTAQLNVPKGSVYRRELEFCEVCDQEMGKRRYFNNNADKKKHMFTHTRPFKCDVAECNNHIGFASPHDLARHKKSCHSLLTVKTSKFYYRCAAPSCQKKDKIWPRKDNFKAHLEGTHKYNEAEVADLLRESECMPSPGLLPTTPTILLKTQRRQLKKARRSQKNSVVETETKETPKSGSAAAGQGDQDIGCMTPELMDGISAYESSEFTAHLSYLKPSGLQHQPLPTFKFSGPPSVSVSDESELDFCCEQASSTNSIEMMDTTMDLSIDAASPYSMVQPPTSPGLSAYEGLPTPFTPGAYTESLLDSDLDDTTTDTEFDNDIYEVETIFQPLLISAVQQLLATYLAFRQNAPHHSTDHSTPSNHASSFRSSTQGSGAISDSLSQPTAGARKRRKADDEDDDNGNERPQKRKGRATKSDENHPPLACPFNKFNPFKYDKCYTFVLKGISRVKQHLERIHSVPIHCPKCYHIFHNNPEARDRHVRQEMCDNAPERRLEGISDTQMRLLKRRAVGKSVQENWYSIFELLFPGARKPESPFLNTSLSAELSAFRDFFMREGQELVSTMAQEAMPSWPHCEREQFEDFTRQVFRNATEQLFLGWQQRSLTARSAANITSQSHTSELYPTLQTATVTSEPMVVSQATLPPTPPSTRIPDLNDMGVACTASCSADEEVLFPTGQQAQEHGLHWLPDESQQQHHQMMYFGEVSPVNNQQYWNGSQDMLGSMGSWSF